MWLRFSPKCLVHKLFKFQHLYNIYEYKSEECKYNEYIAVAGMFKVDAEEFPLKFNLLLWFETVSKKVLILE